MSTENKYQFKGTPAPWVVGKPQITKESRDYGKSSSGMIPIDSDNWSSFVVCYKHEISTLKIARANAQLIAAAPELLQSCIELHQILSPLLRNPAHEDVMKCLQAAIHKALNIK